METSAWGSDKINEAAKAWKDYAESIVKARDGADGLAEKLKAIADYTALIARLGKEQGNPMGDNPLFARKQAEAKAAQLRAAAASAANTAAGLRAEAAQTDPKKDAAWDAKTQEPLDTEAAAAAQEVARLDAEIKGVEDAYSPENQGDPRYIVEHLKYAKRYGVTNSPEEIIGLLKSERAGYQGFVDRGAAGKKRNETNAARRAAAAAMRAKAGQLEGQAKGWTEEATQTEFQGQVGFIEGVRAQGATPNVTPSGTGFGVTPQAMQYFNQANADLEAIGRAWAAGIAALKAQSEAANARNQNRPGE